MAARRAWRAARGSSGSEDGAGEQGSTGGADGTGADTGHSSSGSNSNSSLAAAAAQEQVRIDQELRERNLGVLQGLTRREAAAQHPEAFASLSAPVHEPGEVRCWAGGVVRLLGWGRGGLAGGRRLLSCICQAKLSPLPWLLVGACRAACRGCSSLCWSHAHPFPPHPSLRAPALQGFPESLESLEARAEAVLQKLAARHPGRRILVICHGGFLSVTHMCASWGLVVV